MMEDQEASDERIGREGTLLLSNKAQKRCSRPGNQLNTSADFVVRGKSVAFKVPPLCGNPWLLCLHGTACHGDPAAWCVRP